MKKSTLFIALLGFAKITMAQNAAIEAFLSTPFITNLTISAKSDKIAWVENERGERNIFLAEKPNYTKRRITFNAKDDGLELSNLSFTADEKALIFVRGNAPQLRSTAPHNPAHLLEGGATVIWKITFDGERLEKIGLGGSPSLSPVSTGVFGDKMVFTRGGQIFIKNLNDTMQARQLCQAKGGASQLRWSPDGRKLAFVSNRSGHSFVSVYDFDKNDYTFMSPSIDNDTEPVWSPDGSKIAFMRLRSLPEPKVIFFPVREDEPWSIMVADVSTGKTQSIFTADKGTGSYYTQHTGKQQLLWTATNKIIFAWEKTGWQQLYALAPEGGKPIALTNGNHETDEILLSFDKKQVIYTTNQGELAKKDIFSVNSLGGVAQLLVNDEKENYGIESNVCMASDGKTVFYLKSESRAPNRVTMATDGKVQKYLTDPAKDFDPTKLVTPEVITLTAKNGQKTEAQVFYPKNVKKDKSHPAVVFVHGGSRRQMYPAYHPSWYYANFYHANQYLASKGYVVVSINYRSGIGYGQDFREAKDYGASGNSEFADLEAAGEWLKTNPSVSSQKIGVYGGSYGGFMTAHAMARRSDLFSVGVDIHGVHNWNTEIPTFMPEYDSLRFPKHAQSAYRSSPINYLDGWRSPTLFIHGDDDQNVPFSETEFMVRTLRRKGVDLDVVVIPDEIHSFLRYESWVKVLQSMGDYFDGRFKK
jgi:dipeptidyl aminopeptidase/acylaminoacyl peptidase